MNLSKKKSFISKVLKWSLIYFKRYSNYIFNYGSPKNNIRFINDQSIVHLGNRSIQKKVFINDRLFLKKIFSNNLKSISKFRNEKTAQKVFKHYNWFIPWTKKGLKSFTIPFYPTGSTLNKIGPQLERREQLRIAGQVLQIILDLHIAGYAHRDIKASNFLLVGDQVKLFDFEHLIKYPKNSKSRFSNHYDITGKSLPPFLNCDSICFTSKASDSVSSVLNVSLQEGYDELQKILFRELSITSCGFQNYRNVMREVVNHIYSSFDLGRFSVKPEDARRNTKIRFNQYKVTEEIIRDKKILNLGSCTGAINFEIYKFNPRKSIGIEYDYDKVEIAKKIAMFCDITNIKFLCGDLESMSIDKIGTGYDVVFCCAVEEHLKSPDRLFEIIGKVCNGLLFYEGTASSDLSLEKRIENTKRELSNVGFNSIEYLGQCEDDHNPELNIRPLFRAYK